MTFKSNIALRGFSVAPNNVYEGQAGELPGSADFSAAALFRVSSTGNIGAGLIFGNIDSGETTGWGLSYLAGVLTATAIDSVGPAAIPAAFDMATAGLSFAGKLIHAVLTVAAGAVNLYVQGALRANAAIPNAFVPGVGAPRIGSYNDDAGPANETDVLACAYHSVALTPAQVMANFQRSVDQNQLADLTDPNEPSTGAGFTNLWRVADLASATLPGARTAGPPTVAWIPRPLQTWVDARDPSVFSRSPGAAVNAPLISLAADGFVVPGTGVGLVDVPNPSWM